MNTLKECPICRNQTFIPFLTCKDFLLTSENFTIVSCGSCHFKFTNPIPYANELGKYYASEEYISHSNNAKGIINNIYKIVRNYTLSGKRKLIDSLSKNKGVLLDIGCGTGEFLNVCKRSGWETMGIEPGNDARKYASEKHQLTVHESIESVKNLNSHFDIITMWHVLEHVDDLNGTIETLKKILKKNGTLLIALPNCSSHDAIVYKEYWAAYDVPRHLYHFTPKDVVNLFEKHDMKLQQLLPMWFDSFYIAMLSEKHKYGKTNYLRAVFNGLISNLKAKKTGNTFSSQIYIIKATL